MRRSVTDWLSARRGLAKDHYARWWHRALMNATLKLTRPRANASCATEGLPATTGITECVAELIGTFWLTSGCGTAVMPRPFPRSASALVFRSRQIADDGLYRTHLERHLNPAVTVGLTAGGARRTRSFPHGAVARSAGLSYLIAVRPTSTRPGLRRQYS
jgi:hypothetical protein